MKRHFAILFTILCLGATSAVAQNYVHAQVEISTEKVKLHGKVYLAHPVKARQTVWGISKAYGVSEQDIYDANPSLRETGLLRDSIILIPADKVKPAPKEEEPVPGEVPLPETETPAPEESAPQPEYREHTVRWYEDIEDIARKYKLEAQDILDYNGLSSRKLTTRQVLRIPLGPVVPKASETVPDTPEVTPAVADTLFKPYKPTEKTEVADSTLALAPEVSDSTLIVGRTRDRVKFSLLLPINASGKTSELNMDFYSGVLLALRDLEADSIKVNIDTYDLYAGMPDVEKLAASDFVLGPIAARDIEAVLMLLDNRVNLISPLDQRAAALSSSYSNFIQAPTGVDNQYEDIGQWVMEDLQGEDDRIIFINEKNAASIQAAIGIRSALARRELTYDILSYGISEGQTIPEVLITRLTDKGVNRVVVASESEPFVGDVVRNLVLMLGKGYRIEMYVPSKVKNFETIDGTSLHDVSTHISTAYHVEYGSEKVENFIRAYRAIFLTEPSQFAFQGYDTARYFILRVARYGDRWKESLGGEKSRGLHTDFLFDRDESGNCHNVAVRRVLYKPDYSTVLVR